MQIIQLAGRCTLLAYLGFQMLSIMSLDFERRQGGKDRLEFNCF